MVNQCLLVDRDVQHQNRLRIFCEAEGFQTMTANSLRDACDILSNHLFDIAFIDIDSVDGEELALLGVECLQTAEIIMMGSAFKAFYDDEIAHAGARHYFCKPFDPDYLRPLLSDIVAEVQERSLLDTDIVRIEVGSTLASSERKIILATLEHNHGDKKLTANELGVSLKTLYNRINAYRKADVQHRVE